MKYCDHENLYVYSSSATSRVVLPLLHRNNEQILDTALSKKTYYQGSIYNNSISITFIMGLSITQHALALQFLHPKWSNKHANHEGNSPFITLPLAVLTSVQLHAHHSSCRSHTQKMTNQKLFHCKKICGEALIINIFNTIFLNEMFLYENFQTTIVIIGDSWKSCT